MFGVGLHFSLDDLLAVRRIALPGAVAQITVATLMGATVSWFWGWSLGAGLVFGLALSVASTVVLLKALEARGALETPNGRIAVGWLVVEALVMVLVQAHVARAAVLIVAVRDTFKARQMIETARALNPAIKTIVRVDGEEEASLLRGEHADAAYIAEEQTRPRDGERCAAALCECWGRPLRKRLRYAAVARTRTGMRRRPN